MGKYKSVSWGRKKNIKKIDNLIFKEKKDIILLKNLHKYLYKWKINKKSIF